jgi:hypothetical protein
VIDKLDTAAFSGGYSSSARPMARTGRVNIGWSARHFEQLTITIDRDSGTTHA